jgi:hypothetical protein
VSSPRDQHGQYLYGKAHKAARKRWEQLVARGGVSCWRCGKPIPPGSAWDLGHVDDVNARRVFPDRHPEHIGCNRSTLGRMLAQARGEAPQAPKPAHDCREEFDPERCPECRRRDPTPGNGARRWTRHWCGGPEYNPRCPDCRERGAACKRPDVEAS